MLTFFQKEHIKNLVHKEKISEARQYLNKNTIASSQTKASSHNVYTDLSVISMNDAGTGIQRLVKSIWNEFLTAQPTQDVKFIPIYATRKKKYAISRYPVKNIKKRNYVELGEHDIFLGLDWSADQIITHQKQLYLWKSNGAKLVFIVNDILALQHPEWFTTKNRAKLEHWLKIISVCADQLICVSNTIKNEVETWLMEHHISPQQLPCRAIKLGGEITPILSAHTTPPPKGFEIPKEQPFFLKVSTIEPRKGHLPVIKAFEHLWKTYPQFQHNLFLVGKYGWKSEETIEYLLSSEFFWKKIFWFTNINDAQLIELYQQSTGVINASKGEGFGLPLMEAIYHKKPLLVRDLPVFREVSQNQATYFADDAPEHFAQDILDWAKTIQNKQIKPISYQSWHETMLDLLKILKAL